MELVLVAHMRGLVPALDLALGGGGSPAAVMGAGRSPFVEVVSSRAVRHGVRVGMSRAEAKRRCPEICFVSGGGDDAGNVAASLTEQLATFSPAVELTGDDTVLIRLARVCGPQAAQRIAQWLLVRIGSHFSRRPRIGIGPNVLVARMAARTADGGGIVTLDTARYREVVGAWRVRELPGVTARIARRLHARGVFTIAQLAAAEPERLGLGVAGRVLCRRALGEEPIATADRLLVDVDVAVDTRATARRAPALRVVSAESFEGESARAVERLVTGTFGARIRARLMREGRGGEWMVLPVSGLRRSA